MSADLPSSNPFRRKAAASTAPSAPLGNPSIVNHIAYQQADPLPGSASPEQLDAPKKITKKVRVQSPPPPSPSTPSLPDSSSTIGEEFYSISAKAPTPIPRDDDPFDAIELDVSEEEEPIILDKAPANPFSKTLETMENTGRDGPVIAPPNVSSPGRASMDVEAFKRLLMTGSAGLGTSTSSSAAQAHVAHHALGDGGSSTDTSSLSRQSIFEAIQEPHPESPRTSHEISEPEDDRSAMTAEFLSSAATGRKKPLPPSSRHGKLIKVELKDDSIPKPLQSPPTPGSFTSQQYFTSGHRSQTDLNKPLPPAPRASHEADRESIFDKEAAGKTPEPPSPSSSIRRKTPPPPPLTRRHSQLVSESKLSRSNTTGRLSPKAEEDNGSISIKGKENTRPRSDSVKIPPPPPQSRRPTSIIRGISHNSPLTSPSTVSLPPPPPARGKSGRPPSVHSVDISSNTNNSNKRASMFLPPPPPPHRHGRTSLEAQSADASRRPSGEQSRRSIESARRGSEAERAGSIDILADLSALQREIDALRTQSEKEKQKVT